MPDTRSPAAGPAIVSPSAEALIRIAQIRPEQLPGTLDGLRAFVYEWLDAYVRGNGSIGVAQLESCVARMDERPDLLLDSPRQRELHRLWRAGEANDLKFLMVRSSADSPRVERPAECEGIRISAGNAPAEQIPYPITGQSWPFDVSAATIVKDPQVAHPWMDYFPPVSVEDARARLERYLVVPQKEWEHSDSHVSGADEGGWLVAGKTGLRMDDPAGWPCTKAGAHSRYNRSGVLRITAIVNPLDGYRQFRRVPCRSMFQT